MDYFSEDQVRADRRWLADTMTRVAVRYGRALHDLSRVPGLVALANLRTDPYAPDVQDAAEAIETTLFKAIEELERIVAYVAAITDPGSRTCGVCGAQLVTRNGPELTHWRWVPDPDAPLLRWCEEFEPDHDAQPVYHAPDRPDWRADDTDLTGRTDA